MMEFLWRQFAWAILATIRGAAFMGLSAVILILALMAVKYFDGLIWLRENIFFFLALMLYTGRFAGAMVDIFVPNDY